MIWRVNPDEQQRVVATLCREDGTRDPIHGYNRAASLIIPVGSAQVPESLAGSDASSKPLVVRVARSAGHLNAADDAFIVPPEYASPDNIARGLARAILTPCEPEHPWCCDWNDMQSLIRSVGTEVGRHGFDCAEGQDAARRAALAALEEVGTITDCRVLSLVSRSPQMKDAEALVVADEIRQRLGDGQHIGGVTTVHDFPDEFIWVDIYVFGKALPQPETSIPTRNAAGIDIQDIPAFLRKDYQDW